MAIIEKVWISVEAVDNMEPGLNKVKDDIKGFQERIKSDTAIKLSLNVAQLDQKLKNLRTQIKEAQKSWDFELAINLKADEERLKQQLTSARRELRNFARTWDKDVSVLWKLFAGVNWEIEKSREELIKLWKSTKGLDKLAEQAKQLENEFKKWKINAQEYAKSLNKISEQAKKSNNNLWWLSVKLWDLAKWFLAYQAIDKLKDWLVESGKTAIEFESALAWVNKTLNITPEQLHQIDIQLQKLSTTIPVAYTDLAHIAELWWQLGVKAQDITKFTEAVAKISVSTNLTSEEAATDFARISNIIDEPLSNIDKLASSVVALGNNFASQEDEIVNFATRIAGAWHIAWLTAWDIFWISTAFVSVWVKAEEWWTAVQKALLTMNTAVATWNAKLTDFAKLSWKTRDQFVKDWKSDSWKAFNDFIKELWQAGDKWVLVLNDLVWTDSRLQKAFLSLAQNSKILTKAINTWNKAYKENTALTKEANQRFKTTASQLQLLKNKWSVLWNYIGKSFMPIFIVVAKYITNFFAKLPTAFTYVKYWLTLLLNKFEKWAVWVIQSIKIIPDVFKLLVNSTDIYITNGTKNWTAKFVWFVSAVWKLFNNLVNAIWTSFSNIWPLIWEALNLATKPINSFFNGFIEKYNSTLWRITPKISWKVNLWVNFWEVKKIPSILKGVKEAYNNVWNASLQMSNQAVEWLKQQNESISQHIALLWKQKEKQLSIYDETQRILLKQWNKQLREDKLTEDKAIKITKDWIKTKIALQNEAVQKYLDWLWKKDTNTTKTNKKIQDNNKKMYEAMVKWTEKETIAYSKEMKKREAEHNTYLKNKEAFLKKTYKTVSEVLDKEASKVKETISKYDDQIKSLKQWIQSINDSLKGLEKGKTTDLSSRYVEIEKQLAEINKQKKKDLTQINKLLKEKALIEKNVDKKTLNQAVSFDKLSPTEKILKEYKAKKKQYEQEKAIKIKEVKDLQKQKEQEKTILAWFTVKKAELDQKYKDLKISIEKEITDTVIKESNKQIDKLEELRQKAIAAAKAMSTAWIVWQTNANTTNHNNIKVEIKEANNPKLVAQQVQDTIVKTYKNVWKGSF